MNDFLIKSSVCALVLLLAYHLFLEREKMHRFNRFFLLLALVLSFVIPFITIEIVSESIQPLPMIQDVPLIQQHSIATAEPTDYLPYVLWALYGIGAAFFSSRFVNNLTKIIRKQKSALKVKLRNANLALVNEPTLPHTFGNTIFINETDYNNRNIEAELYLHELTHVSQKHTLDVLFIEIIKTIFWFNPIFIFYKKAIQLNHEFLADEKVITTNENITHYQQLLLSKANGAIISLASNLHYSLTKKRLVMMGKYTSKPTAFFKKLMLLPILSALLFCMCTKETERQDTTDVKSFDLAEIDKNRDLYFAGVMVHLIDKNENITLDKPYEQLTLAQKRKYMIYFPMPQVKKMPTSEEFEDFKDAAKYELSLNDKSAPNSILNHYKPKDIAYYETLAVAQKNRSKRYPQAFQCTVYTHDYFESHFLNRNRKFGGKEYRMTFDNNHWAKVDSILNAEKLTKTAAVSKSAEYAIVKDGDSLYFRNRKNQRENTIYAAADQKAEPPNGFQDWYTAIMKHYKIPPDFTGRCNILVEFVVEKNGSLSNIKILREAGSGTGAEAIRVLKLSEKWRPAKLTGKTVRSSYTLPIMINATE